MTSLIECKNIKVDKNDPRGAVWCPRCIHFTTIGINTLCDCCSFKIGARPRNQIDVSVFEKIVLSNTLVLDAYMKNKCPRNFEFGWVIQFGLAKQFVPVRYIAEFMELKEYNDLRKFVDRVKKECSVLPRYVKSVK